MAKDLKSVIAFAGQRSGANGSRPFGSTQETHAGHASYLRRQTVAAYDAVENAAEHDDCADAVKRLSEAGRMHGAYVVHAADGRVYVDSMTLERDRAEGALMACFRDGGWKE